MDLIEQALRQALAKLPATKLWVAYSGGLDSTVLLFALQRCITEFPQHALQAAHVHHGLNQQADDWLAHCERFCNDLQIKLFTHRLPEAFATSNIEAQARECRYDWFAELLGAGDVLLTAHHQDDQAETVLLNLCRGAGVKGLAAMPEEKSFAKGSHLRPLLSFSREALEVYAREHKLTWVDDPSNESTDFSRNLLRHKVLPALQQRWPRVIQQLSRTACLMQGQLALLNELGKEELAKVALDAGEVTLAIEKLVKLSSQRLLNVLRFWIAERGFLLPDQRRLHRIVNEVIRSRSDSRACVSWQGAECRRWRNELHLMPPLAPFDTTQCLTWPDLSKSLRLPQDLGELVAQAGGELSVMIPAGAHVEVRFRQGGERLALPGRAGHHELKKLFQEWGVPYWLRDRVPLVFINDELAVVVGYALAAGFVGKNCQYSMSFKRFFYK